MKKYGLMMLALSLVLFLTGCAKKAQQETSAVPQEMMEDTATTTQQTAADQTQADQSNPSQTAGTLESQDAAQDLAGSSQQIAQTANPSSQDIQQALKNLGLYDGSIDGNIGAKTKRAIREFQAQNDLKVDGKVGPKTWARLQTQL